MDNNTIMALIVAMMESEDAAHLANLLTIKLYALGIAVLLVVLTRMVKGKPIWNGTGNGYKKALEEHARADAASREVLREDIRELGVKLDKLHTRQGELQVGLAEVRVIAQNAQRAADQSHGRTDDILKTAATKK